MKNTRFLFGLSMVAVLFAVAKSGIGNKAVFPFLLSDPVRTVEYISYKIFIACAVTLMIGFPGMMVMQKLIKNHQ